MATSYADSAQAREWDKRFDDWGKPRTTLAEIAHDYNNEADLAARREQEVADRARLKRRIGLAMTQMEAICPPVGGTK
ncbi:hypothetical protein C1Y08_20770 [Pseudomonas sp. FW306-02-F02-AA]|uniref:Uncharacterized protein n=1 Tax=Pseudomonas fluorescens TaxID=294 RepID=A0A0N9VUR0_PSEFL|nr:MULTISPECIES: hypothetical protein [Pseudomonas]ALI04418.1 hypothetical protein AO353_26400 [Pseudomonas fluorescens]PMZ03896.1 hypothetical protein C1Y07_11865 [Pseudomonas sp. FW306-02-F02-AB]PMZ08261.1 hypothetical protein C1Y06_20205 [Pseudomonas sp. FW306-02-H06C]PMZ14001.1 hypothetical protein C1Y08_20770 [Pseudomonas sp. FW306-02-F02-AA]PMZ21490.1 hypothetical protein C1Y09_13685 [Pseudomonas sp. FW306-02-F08-AA]